MNIETKQKRIIAMALQILERQLKQKTISFTSPELVISYLRLRLEQQDREHFLVLYLDNQNQLISSEILFIGTINATEVHPREIARSALKHNAAAVILAHNHPSGHAEPSKADRYLTETIADSLSIFDIRTLDHIVIGHSEVVSFAERGWI